MPVRRLAAAVVFLGLARGLVLPPPPLSRRLLSTTKAAAVASRRRVTPSVLSAAATTTTTPPPLQTPTEAPLTSRLTASNPALVLWRFSRPHTLIGTMLSVPAVHLLAAPTAGSALTLQFWFCAVTALVPAMLVNIFITGLNQVCDADIDKINKPTLPIAAGDLSLRAGVATCLVSLVLAALLTAIPGVATAPLVAVLAGSAALGAAYSAPPFRLKRWPTLAALSILVVRGILVNACFFAHAQRNAFPFEVARSAAEAHLGAVVSFFALFGVSIALLKDVPDTRGDSEYGVRTLSTTLGRARVFAFASTLTTGLLAAASAALGWAAAYSALVSGSVLTGLVATRLFAGLGLAALAALAFRAAHAVKDPELDRPVATYYMRIWSIFYLCYALLPFAR